MRFVSLAIVLLMEATLAMAGELRLNIVEGTQGSAAVANASVVIKESGATRTTTSAGTVRLPIAEGLPADAQLTIHVEWKGWVVAEPPAGKVRVPANSATTVEIVLLPRGSPKLLSHEHLVQLLQDAASLKRQFSRGKDTDANAELTAFVAEWANRNGFVLEQVKSALEEWAKGVQARSDDRFETALAEFAQRQFGKAAASFETSAELAAASRKQIDAKTAELLAESERLRKHESEAHSRAGDAYRFDRRWDRATNSYRMALALLDPDRDAWQYIQIEDNFVDTLHEYAIRVDDAKGKALIEEAIQNFRLTAKLIREHFDWSVDLSEGPIQSELGVLLSALADKSSPQEADGYYREALAAHRRAQELLQKAGNRENWADNQVSLGMVMFSMATRGPDARLELEEAAKVLRSALEVYTKDGQPLKWTGTHVELGLALVELSGYYDGPAAVKIGTEATAAVNEALSAMPATAPEEWPVLAMIALSGGMMYTGRAAAEPEARKHRLAAVAVGRQFAARLSPDAIPFVKGGAHIVLGLSLSELSDSSPPEEAVRLLRESVAESKAAGSTLTRDSYPSIWGYLVGFRGMAVRRLGRLTPGDAGNQLLRDAIANLRECLEANPRDAGPSDWAETQTELGAALRDLALRYSGDRAANLFAESAEAYRLALEAATPERAPRVNRMAREGMAQLEAARKGQ